MYAVEVALIARGQMLESLTFFSKEPIQEGAVVQAPVRGRRTPALVLAVTDVRDKKLDLKAAAFSLRKLEIQNPRLLYTPSFMRAARAAGDYSLVPTGRILAELSCMPILKNAGKLESAAPQSTGGSVTPDVLVLMAEQRDRIHTYRNLVREAFAHRRSVIIVAPTLAEVEYLKSELSRGIEDRVHTATSAESDRALLGLWQELGRTESALLIGTPPAISFPLQNVEVIVVERESAQSYLSRGVPPFDERRVIEFFARESGARLVLADYPLRVETYARTQGAGADELVRHAMRSASTARIHVVDTKKGDTGQTTRRHFLPLGGESLERLKEVTERNERAVVFAARRGIAPLTVCNDCGTPVLDPSTGVPMVLERSVSGNVFVSHRSGAVLPAERACVNCGGWNLVSLGIGAHRVFDEVRKYVPKGKVLLLTQETARTHVVAKKVISTFYKTPGAILVGTERMLPYLTRPIPLSVVASIDSLLSLPAWRAGERALHILFTLLARTTDDFIIESRKVDSPVVRSLASSSPMEYLRQELAERRTYSYPPFKLFVGLSWTGTAEACERTAAVVKKIMHDEDLVGPLPPEAIARAKFVARAVIRVEPSEWPSAQVKERLAELPLGVLVTIDPDDIV